MKIRANWLIVPAAVLSFAACNKKEEAQVPDAPATSETEPASPGETPAPTAPTSSLSTEERAAKLGFVKHLPQDTEVVLAFHNGSKAATHIKSSKLWELVQSELSPMFGGGPPMDMEIEEDDFEMEEVEQDTAATDDEEEVAEPSGPAALFGTEFSMAMGKSTGAQTANLIMLNQRLGYFQMRAISKAFVTSLKTGDFSTMEDSLESTYGPELVTDLLNDSESGVALFEQMRMPPMYFAFRATSENRASAAQQLASLVENLAMLGELVEPVSVEKDGQTFAGQKISGKQLANMMDMEGRKDLEEMLEPEMVNRLITAVSKKDLVILTGTVGDYAVLFIGASPDDLAFAADPASSLVGNDALAFSDAYASKELAALVYGQKASIDQMIHAAGGLSHFANGLRDGLAGSEGLGDTRDIEELLRIVSERESALMKLAGNDALGTVAFFEDGLKIESFGGSDSGAIDWKSPNKLASLGDSEDVVLFANVTVNAGYDEKAHDYLEALMETAYAIMTKVAEAPAASSDMTQFKEMATMFDSKFRADLVAPSLAFGYAVARIGCFLNGCCHGGPTDFIGGIDFPHDDVAGPIHPVQLYASVGSFLLGLILLWLTPKIRVPGHLAMWYLVLYSVLRSAMEHFRRGFTAEPWGPVSFLTQAQAFSILVAVIALVVVFATLKRVGYPLPEPADAAPGPADGKKPKKRKPKRQS